MILCITVVFVLELVIFSLISRKLFPGFSSMDFPTHEAYFAFGVEQEQKVRQSHIMEATIAGLTAGLIVCFFNNTFVLPVISAMVVLECVWLLLTPLELLQPEKKYNNMPHLFVATVAALVIGVILSFLSASALAPVIVAVALFWVAWLMLMPM